MRASIRAVVIVLLAVTVGGCASRAKAPAPVPVPVPAPAPAPNPRTSSAGGRALDVREGLASYYADWFNGRTTASGTIFSNNELVAAHPSYPFGSLVRVVNLRNKRSIDLRIVDRGPAAAPQARGVIIDISRAAAERLGFINAGRTRVRVEVLRWGGDN
jgi:rare lipoprotein A